jgi:hypothetical protein
MSKIVLDNVASGYDLSKINVNFQKIADELNNNVLYRNAPIGEPNTLEKDIDANGKKIYNLGSISLEGEASLSDLVAEAQLARDEAVTARDITVILENAFSDLFLGAKASDPALDNDGGSLQAGALYLKTTGTPLVRVYNGATWQDVGTYTSTTTTSIDAALYASQVEAEQGVNDAKVVTPLKVKQSIAAEVGTSVQAYDATILKEAAIGVTVQAHDADIPTVAASQAEMEAGTETALRSMSPLRIKQAIAALATSSGGIVKFSTGSGSWVVPAGVTSILVSGSGGGGGGSGSGGGSGESSGAGSNGGSTVLSSGASLTLAGGIGGAATTTASTQSANGGVGVYDGLGGAAGCSTNYKGNAGAAGAQANRRKITVTPGATINYTIGTGGNGGYAYSGNGAGGTGGTNADTASSAGSAYAGTYYGGAGGGGGFIIIEW